MKIEIDLNDIFGADDEGPGETLQESVRRQVVESLTAHVQKGIGDQIRAATANAIDEALSKAVAEQMPGIVANLLDHPYTPVTRFGERSSPTTFRAQLLAKIMDEMTFQPARDSYSRDKENIFTKAVRGACGDALKGFKEEFLKNVAEQSHKEALIYAVQELGKRLGIKA